MPVTITERGWAGHFISSSRCRFRRNTLVCGNHDSVVVSTVGALCVDNKIHTIGHNRYYETMAFGAVPEGPYVEASVSDHQRIFDSPWSIEAKSAADLPDDVDNIANEMHDTVVREFAWKLSSVEDK